MSRRAPRRASLADVARLAGVSSQTVSRVVRGLGVVADPTRERVLKAVAELEYRPNLAARSLSLRRTGVIHVVNATPLFYGHARTFLAIVSELNHLGFQISVAEAPVQANPTLDTLVPLGVDGIILLGGHTESAQLAATVHGRLPVVFIGQRDGLPDGVATVTIDHSEGSRLATQHLIDAGYKRLLHVCGPKDWVDSQDRRDGFAQACHDANIEFQKVSAGTWDAEQGYQTVKTARGFDGVFASNDMLALGAMRALTEQGLNVPDDVGVVGFDDIEGAANFLPPLTTVRQPHMLVGRTAVSHLSALIEGKPAEHTIIAPDLIVRDSTKGN